MTAAGKPFRELITDWLAAYDDLYATLNALTPVQRDQPNVCGTWTPRQVVAHLAGWHYEAIRRFFTIMAAKTPDQEYDEDAFNALQIEARAHLSWELTLDDLHEVIDILRLQAYDVPEAKAEVDNRYANWMLKLTNEAREHCTQIQAACPPE